MSKETLAKSIREIPDFPIPGILFYDVTTLFKDPARLQELSDTLYEMYKDKGITKVVGIESRGFIMGPILATRLGAGFIPIRKPGKLPAETIEESYDKEYGKGPDLRILRNLNSYCRYRQRNKLYPFHRQRKPSLRYPVHSGYDRSVRDEPGFRDH